MLSTETASVAWATCSQFSENFEKKYFEVFQKNLNKS
jgi:hypothetical protein